MVNSDLPSLEEAIGKMYVSESIVQKFAAENAMKLHPWTSNLTEPEFIILSAIGTIYFQDDQRMAQEGGERLAETRPAHFYVFRNSKGETLYALTAGKTPTIQYSAERDENQKALFRYNTTSYKEVAKTEVPVRLPKPLPPTYQAPAKRILKAK